MPPEPRPPAPSDGLYAPRPVRGDAEAGRLLLALEIPDCCPISRPCPHVPEADHGVPLDDWADLLRGYDAEGYFPLLPPPPPALALTRRARVSLLCGRAEDGRQLYHPRDGIPLLGDWLREEGTADLGVPDEAALMTRDTPKGELRLIDFDGPPPPRTLAEAWLSEDATAEELLALFRGRPAWVAAN